MSGPVSACSAARMANAAAAVVLHVPQKDAAVGDYRKRRRVN